MHLKNIIAHSAKIKIPLHVLETGIQITELSYPAVPARYKTLSWMGVHTYSARVSSNNQQSLAIRRTYLAVSATQEDSK